jgi:hypothetical protein
MGISHKRDRVVKGGRNRKSRSRSFKTEDAAKKYAQENGIKEFTIVKPNNGLSSKIKILQK